MKLSKDQQAALPDWARYEEDSKGGVVVVDADIAYKLVIKALKLPTNQNSAEVARRWVAEILMRRLFTFGLADTEGNAIGTGMSYEQMAALRADVPGSTKVVEGLLRWRPTGKKYRLADLPEAEINDSANFRRFSAQMNASGLLG